MADFNQHHFDHLLPRQSLLRVNEVAKILQISDHTVMALIDTGQIVSHRFGTGKGLRMNCRIPLQSLQLFLLKSKQYEIPDYLASILELLATLSAPELRAIQTQLPRLVARATSRQQRTN